MGKGGGDGGGEEGWGSRGGAAAAVAVLEISCAPGAQGGQLPCVTPHDDIAHTVPSNVFEHATPLPTHQPRSWLNEEAPVNIQHMSVTLLTAHPPMSWLKAEASLNMYCMSVTPEVSHAPMSWLIARLS